MERAKDGFYTRNNTSNTIAIMNNVGYYVCSINGKKIISNEKVPFTYSMLLCCSYLPFSV